jgi:hypothetical protein
MMLLDRKDRLKLIETQESLVDDSYIEHNSIRRDSSHSEGGETSDWQRLFLALQPVTSARCSVQRRKTTLWTTYHLCVDAVDGVLGESDSTGQELSQRRPKGLFLCARRVKSGISGSQYLVWLAGSGGLKGKEDWKEKLAVGRLHRGGAGGGGGGLYTGRLTPEAAAFLEQGMCSSSMGTWDGTAARTCDYEDCRRGAVCVRVMSGGLDRLNHVAAVAALDVPWTDDGAAAAVGATSKAAKSSSNAGDSVDEEMMAVLMVSVLFVK